MLQVERTNISPCCGLCFKMYQLYIHHPFKSNWLRVFLYSSFTILLLTASLLSHQCGVDDSLWRLQVSLSMASITMMHLQRQNILHPSSCLTVLLAALPAHTIIHCSPFLCVFLSSASSQLFLSLTPGSLACDHLSCMKSFHHIPLSGQLLHLFEVTGHCTG